VVRADRQLGLIIVALLASSCGSDHVSFAELPIPGPMLFDHCSPAMEDAIDTRDLALIRNFKARGGIGNCEETQALLHDSIRNHDTEGLVAGLAAGADPNTPLIVYGCRSALAYAFRMRHDEIGDPAQPPPRTDTTMLKLLLDAGANPNSDTGWHPAYCLLARLPNGAPYSPLNEAVIVGDVEFARLLIDAGANVTAADAEGRTALDLAPFGTRPENREAMAALLREAMARPQNKAGR